MRRQEQADVLWRAQRERAPCAPLTESDPELSVEAAYAIQRINLERAPGELVGRKIGLTSRALQEWLGVDRPDFGGLLTSMRREEGEPIEADALLQPRAEAEVAFVLERDLDAGPIGPAQVIGATAYLLPALEIIDSRIQDWSITYADTIADNASSGLFVLGQQPAPLDGAALATAGMTLRKNGRLVSTGVGAACLGHPLRAVVWLANALLEAGDPLRAGQIVLSGALGPVTEIAPGDDLHAEIARVGSVRARFV